MRRRARVWVGLLLAVGALGGGLLPDWIRFVLTVALGQGLAALGVALLLRAGLVSFGHGMFYALGAYSVGFLSRFGVREVLWWMPAAILAAFCLALSIGPLLARYREIWFGMLSLAFSMGFYGLLSKLPGLTGGTDGMRIGAFAFFGAEPAGGGERVLVYYLALFAAAMAGYLIWRYLQAPAGYTARAIRDNEVRVDYLGSSVHRTLTLTYLISGVLAALGGVFQALVVGHIDPQLGYWTTSAEFVFIALLGGIDHPLMPFGGAIIVQFIKSYANKYLPYTWQMTLGLLLLLSVLFVPSGLGTLVVPTLRRRRSDQG